MNNMINMNNNNLQNQKMNLNNLTNKFIANSLPNDNTSNNKDMQESSIIVTFSFKKYDRQIYIDANRTDKFSYVIQQLEEKYNWLVPLENKKYYLNGKEITSSNKTLDELGVNGDLDINIEV